MSDALRTTPIREQLLPLPKWIGFIPELEAHGTAYLRLTDGRQVKVRLLHPGDTANPCQRQLDVQFNTQNTEPDAPGNLVTLLRPPGMGKIGAAFASPQKYPPGDRLAIVRAVLSPDMAAICFTADAAVFHLGPHAVFLSRSRSEDTAPWMEGRLFALVDAGGYRASALVRFLYERGWDRFYVVKLKVADAGVEFIFSVDVLGGPGQIRFYKADGAPLVYSLRAGPSIRYNPVKDAGLLWHLVRGDV